LRTHIVETSSLFPTKTEQPGLPCPPRRTSPPHLPGAMQTANDRYIVRLSGALAALLGDVELPEDEWLGWLRAQGLITYPSPLLEGLLGGELPEVLAAKMLPRLGLTDLAIFGRVDPASRAAVVASGSPRAGAIGGVEPFRLNEFFGSVERLAWAGENGCPGVPRTYGCVSDTCGRSWDVRVCHEAAAGGHLEVLIWAWEHGCPWEEDYTPSDDEDDNIAIIRCCALAAKGGHLEVLKWLRTGVAERIHEGVLSLVIDGEDWSPCPWDQWTCANATTGGHLEVLKWARAHGCPWRENLYQYEHDQECAALAARGGHLQVLRWLWDNDYPWLEDEYHHDGYICARAAEGGHLEVLKWLREHEFGWNARTVYEATEAGHDDVLQWALANGCPSINPLLNAVKWHLLSH